MRLNRLAVLFVAILMVTASSCAQDGAPMEGVYNVFQIKVSGYTGTAFTMAVDGRQYLITAKHMVAKLKNDGSPESIEMLVGDYYNKNNIEWKTEPVRIFACEDPIDIAVIVTEEFYGRTKSRDLSDAIYGELSFEAHPDGHPLGQEAYFMGFPFGAAPTKGPGGPLPFSKRAALSLNYWNGKADTMYFDGYNNHGFSGAPVLFKDPLDTRPNRSHYFVGGVVSGFIPELVKTANWRRSRQNEDVSRIEQWRVEKRADGFTYILEDTDTVVPLNTGIIVAYNIRHAVELIKAHPIGPKIPEVNHDVFAK
jgi:hypothetical protein